MIDLSDLLEVDPTAYRFPAPAGESPSDVFVTSDEHYGHHKIVEYAERPFSSVEEMDETLIAYHNETVRPWDITWHLGDYALGDRSRGLGYLSRLNGIHVLVDGNHDKCFHGDPRAWRYQREYLAAGFVAVQASATLKLPPTRRERPARRVMLSHFPYTGDHRETVRFGELRLRDEGMWLVHGHVHNAYTVRNRGVNVGVDAWNYRPVSVRTVAALIDDVEAGRRDTD